MKIPRLADHASKIAARHRVTKGASFRLKDHNPGDTGGLPEKTKDAVKESTAEGVARLAELQERLYAENRHAVLVILQAMDTAGKDGVIRHVMSGLNPQSCRVAVFKTPGTEELSHDFLWRAARALPERGTLGIFNRSHYEETLVVRVHPEFLDKQRLPAGCRNEDLWKHRFESIRDFEKHLVRNGVTVLKFFLHISKEEQRRRLLARLDEPGKNWKFSGADLAERARWDDYMKAYEETIRHTATPGAPWFVVPADHKWYARHVVTATLLDALQKIDPKIPTTPSSDVAGLRKARRSLEAER